MACFFQKRCYLIFIQRLHICECIDWHKNVINEQHWYNTIWPASCEKGHSDICKKCRPRPAAASPTYTYSQGLHFQSAYSQGLHFLTLVTYLCCCVNNVIMHGCFKRRIGGDLGLHYVKCPKVPFRMTLANYNNTQTKVYYQFYFLFCSLRKTRAA